MTDGLHLVTDRSIDALWPQLEPLFARSCQHAGHGEMDAEHIKLRHDAGSMLIFAGARDRAVDYAVAIELMRYPKMLVANVVALGGSGVIHGTLGTHWPMIVARLKARGVVAIDTWCSDAMARVLARGAGFSKVYNHMRVNLEEVS